METVQAIDIKAVLQSLFEQHFKEKPTQIFILPPSGSNRQYFRISSEQNQAIGVYNPLKIENRSFFYFTSIFEKYKIPVGAVLSKSADQQYYLVADLGGQNLLEKLHADGFTDEVKNIYKESLRQLAKMQWIAGKEIDYDMCYEKKLFDFHAIFNDLNYFKFYFADLLRFDYDKTLLQEELIQWAKKLDSIRPQTFMYRDFQGRNIQILNGKPYFIDYQGGMQGLPLYDVVSLLWQAKAQLPQSWKNELFDYYINVLKEEIALPQFDESLIARQYLDCILLRIMQTLGAYGYRGLIEKKPHFLSSIEPALKQLNAFLEQYPHYPEYPELRKVLQKISSPEIIAQFLKPKPFDNQFLTINIYSFSFRKGMPLDVTGNGGGYVFDCRGILNPGRQEEYKSLTGMDKPVQDYLLTQTKMPEFLEHVYQTVDITIADYLDRNFEHLSICFGCTGGQHRSVFGAISLANHIQEKFGLKVHLNHLEQEGKEVLRR